MTDIKYKIEREDNCFKIDYIYESRGTFFIPIKFEDSLTERITDYFKRVFPKSGKIIKL